MTAQYWEDISIDGMTAGMTSRPLDAWLAKQSPPLDMEAICPCFTTALWRGYIGQWRITDNQLWLDRMTRDTETSGERLGAPAAELIFANDGRRLPMEVDMRLIFDGNAGPIDCDWFTGKLRLPLEPALVYVHMGWASTYRYERILHIRQGRVVRERHIDHTVRFLAAYGDLHRVLTERDHPEDRIGLQGLTSLTDEGRILVAEHLGLVPIRHEEP